MARSTTPVPQTRDADPQVAALITRGNELKAEKRRLESDLDAIESGIVGARSRDALDAAARELLADGVGSLSAGNELHAQRDAVQAKLRVVLRAIEMSDRELMAARASASRRIAEARRPEYEALIRKMKPAVVALQAAIADEAAFRDSLYQADVPMGDVMPPLTLDQITWPIEQWLADAATHYGV